MSSLTLSGIKPGESGDFAQDGQVGVGRQHDDGLDARRDGVFGQGIAGVPLSRHRQPGQAERPSHRDRHGHAPILERQGRIGTEAGVGLPLVLDLETAPQSISQRMGVGQAGCTALAPSDDVPAIRGIVDVQRQEAAEPPQVAPRGFHQPSAPASALSRSRSMHHLHGPAVVLAQVHDRSGRILGATDVQDKMRDITHRAQSSRVGTRMII